MNGLASDWNRFWFSPESTAPLGLFRIALGIAVWGNFVSLWADRGQFYGETSVLPADLLATMAWDHTSTLLRWIQAPLAVNGLLLAQCAATFCFIAGLWTRTASVALFVLFHTFHAGNLLVSIGGDKILHCLLFLFVFSPAGASFSLDAHRRGIKAAPHSPWALRMMQIQITAVYLVTGIQKLVDPVWYGGEAMYYVWGTATYQVWGMEQLLNWPFLCQATTYIVLATELAIPLLLWSRWRGWGLLLCAALQGFILCTMVLGAFPVVMLACIAPFIGADKTTRIRCLVSRLGVGLRGSRFAAKQ